MVVERKDQKVMLSSHPGSGTPKIPPDTIKRILEMSGTHTQRQISDATGISTKTIGRYIRAYRSQVGQEGQMVIDGYGNGASPQPAVALTRAESLSQLARLIDEAEGEAREVLSLLGEARQGLEALEALEQVISKAQQLHTRVYRVGQEKENLQRRILRNATAVHSQD